MTEKTRKERLQDYFNDPTGGPKLLWVALFLIGSIGLTCVLVFWTDWDKKLAVVGVFIAAIGKTGELVAQTKEVKERPGLEDALVLGGAGITFFGILMTALAVVFNFDYT